MKTLAAHLDDLHAYEHEQGLLNAHACAPAGVVEDIRALYRDRVHVITKTPAFHRPGAPLHALPLLAEQTVVFVPPVPRDQLVRVLGGTPPEVLFELPEERVIALIAWPKEYAGPECRYLEPLLRRCPVSMPVRGHALVHGMGRGDLFRAAPADNRLAALAALPLLQGRWAAEFPSAATSASTLQHRVLQELTNNYIDLCIFGYEGLLEEVLDDPDPVHRATRLLRTAELLTYPSLIGMDGQAQYQRVRPTDAAARPEVMAKVLPDQPLLHAIVKGIDVNLEPLARDPIRYAEVIADLHKHGVVPTIARMHERLVEAIAESERLDDTQANMDAQRLMNEIALAKGEIAERAQLVPSDAQVKLFIGAGLAAFGPIATGIQQLLGEVGFQHLLLLTAASTSAGAIAKEAEAFRTFIRTRVARSVFRRRWSFDLWQMRDALTRTAAA